MTPCIWAAITYGDVPDSPEPINLSELYGTSNPTNANEPRKKTVILKKTNLQAAGIDCLGFSCSAADNEMNSVPPNENAEVTEKHYIIL